MVDRIFKNWKTSILGVGIIAAGFYLVWHDRATLTEFTAFVVTALVAVFARDPKKKSSEQA